MGIFGGFLIIWGIIMMLTRNEDNDNIPLINKWNVMNIKYYNEIKK